MEWSHPAPRMREMVLAMRAIWDTWQNGTPLAVPRRLLHAHADDAVLRARRAPTSTAFGVAEDLPRRRRRADDRGRRRGLRRLHLPRLHDRALPPRGHAARRSSAAGPRPARRWRASRSSARASSSPARRRGAGARRPRAPASRSRSTARRPPTGPCSSCTAGAACRTSSTRCRSRASGSRWATLIDDEMLNTFAVVGAPEQIAPELHRRYGDVIQRISFYAPVHERPRPLEQGPRRPQGRADTSAA